MACLSRVIGKAQTLFATFEMNKRLRCKTLVYQLFYVYAVVYQHSFSFGVRSVTEQCFEYHCHSTLDAIVCAQCNHVIYELSTHVRRHETEELLQT